MVTMTQLKRVVCFFPIKSCWILGRSQSALGAGIGKLHVNLNLLVEVCEQLWSIHQLAQNTHHLAG